MKVKIIKLEPAFNMEYEKGSILATVLFEDAAMVDVDMFLKRATSEPLENK